MWFHVVMAADKLEGLKRELTCTLCDELFKQPKNLPCGHRFCLECLIETVRNHTVDSEDPSDSPDVLTCPICRKKVQLESNGVEDLPTDVGIKAMTDIFLKESQAPITAKEPESETKEPAKEATSAWVCPKCKCEGKTDGEDAVYCKHCADKVICAACAISDKHRDHVRRSIDSGDLRKLPEIYDDKVKDIRTLLESTSEIEHSFERAIEAVEKTKKTLQERKRELADAVEQKFKHHMETLEKQKQFLLQKLDEIGTKKSENLETQHRELEKRQQALQRGVADGRELCDDFSKHDFFRVYDDHKERLEKLVAEQPQHIDDPCESNIISFKSNDEFDQMLQSEDYNAIGRVFADPHPKQIAVHGLDSAHFIVNRETELTVSFHDITGTQLQIDHHDIQVEMTPEGEGADAKCVIRNDAGEYKVSITPQTQHRHTITVRVPSLRKSFVQKAVVTVSQHADFGGGAVRTIIAADTQHKMTNPWGLAISREQGRIAVSDTNHHYVLVFDQADLTYKGFIGRKGSGEVEFNSPRGLAFTAQNNLIVVEKDNHRVQEVTLDSKFIRFFGKAQSIAGNDYGQFVKPTGVVLNGDNIVFVTDTGNLRIQYFQPNGLHLGTINCVLEGTPQRPFQPYGIAVHMNKYPVIVQESKQERTIETLVISNREGSEIQQILLQRQDHGDQFGYRVVNMFRACKANHVNYLGPCVGGVIVHPTTGYIFVTILCSQRVLIFSRQGECIHQFDRQGAGIGFGSPMSIVFNGNTQAIVTDCHANCLHVFDVPFDVP